MPRKKVAATAPRLLAFSVRKPSVLRSSGCRRPIPPRCWPRSVASSDPAAPTASWNPSPPRSAQRPAPPSRRQRTGAPEARDGSGCAGQVRRV